MLNAKLNGTRKALDVTLNNSKIDLTGKDKQEKTIVPTKESQYVVADKGYELTKVTVEPIPDNFIEPTGVFEIEENGQYDITEYKTLVSNVPAREDLDAELNEQDALLNELDGKIDELPDREIDLSEATATADDVFEGKVAFGQEGKIVGTYKDMLQRRVDGSESCYYLFYQVQDEDMSWVKNLDTSKAKSMQSMFSGCSNAKVIDVSSLDTSNTTNMSYMFYSCGNLTVIDVSNFNTSNVTNMSNMFDGCKNVTTLNVSNFNTSNVTNMNYMFQNCEKLTVVDMSNSNMSNVTNMWYMFASCDKLTTVFFSDTSKATNMRSIFGNGCYDLTTVESLDMRSITDAYYATYMFDMCRSLTNLKLKNIKVSLDLSSSKVLTNESLLNTIKELRDLTGGTSQTLTLSPTSKTNIANIYVKLIEATDEMRAEDPYIDNKKPCVVCESTDEGAMKLTEYAISKNWSIA